MKDGKGESKRDKEPVTSARAHQKKKGIKTENEEKRKSLAISSVLPLFSLRLNITKPHKNKPCKCSDQGAKK